MKSLKGFIRQSENVKKIIFTSKNGKGKTKPIGNKNAQSGYSTLEDMWQGYMFWLFSTLQLIRVENRTKNADNKRCKLNI